ncbi:MAG: hypothetical protein AABW67_01715 [Nanoarchaeota archaeon]
MKKLLKTFENYGGWIFCLVLAISWLLLILILQILIPNQAQYRIDEPIISMFLPIGLVFGVLLFSLGISFLICLIIDACKQERSKQTKSEKVVTEEEPVEKSEKESSILPLRLVLILMFLFGASGFSVGLVLVEIFKTSMVIAFLMASAFAILGFIASVFVAGIFDISDSLDNIKKVIEELKQIK